MAMQDESSNSRWEGKTTAEFRNSTAERVWSILEDFCNIHKWFPIVETCYQVEGVTGKPGLIRYCALTTTEDDGKKITKWAKEKLLMIDPVQRCLSYEIVDSNMGFKSYVATLKVLPIINDDEKPDEGCRIEWSFVCDPIEGWTFESFYSFVQSALHSMANKVELGS